MLRTASTFVFVCCLLMCDWALSTSWEAPSLEDAVGQSDLIGVFSEVRKQALESKESKMYVFHAENTEIIIKGEKESKLTFCARSFNDFSKEVDRYLLFLYRPPEDSNEAGYEKCSYLLSTFTQHAFPVIDFNEETRSGLILILRSAVIIPDEYELHWTLSDLFMAVDLQHVLTLIREQLSEHNDKHRGQPSTD